MALIAALNNPLIVVRFLLPSAEALIRRGAIARARNFDPVALARVPLFVLRRFLALARGLLLRSDNQPVLRLAFGVRLLLLRGPPVFLPPISPCVRPDRGSAAAAARCCRQARR